MAKSRVSKDHQQLTRKDGTPLYSIHTLDWSLFMWFVSLEKVEHLVCLFIVTWDSVYLTFDSELDFKKKTSEMILWIENLASLKAISNENKAIYNKNLSDYRDYRLHGTDRSDLVDKAWVELEQHGGLRPYSHAIEIQLGDCSYSQKINITSMIKSRLKSIRDCAKEIKGRIEKEIEGLDCDRDGQCTNNVENVTIEVSDENSKIAQVMDVGRLDYDRDGQCTNNVGDVTIEISDESNNIAQVMDVGRLDYDRDGQVGQCTNNIDNVTIEVSDKSSKIAQVMDFEWRDDNENNPRQLVKDIENLYRVLDKFTVVKRKVKKINRDAVTELLTSLKCNTGVDNKLVLGAALQQHLIKFILNFANKNYFKQAQENLNEENIAEDKLEAAIQFNTEELIDLTTRFEKTHREIDEHSRILPTILRQQCYAALGNRGFPTDHPFIKRLVKELTDELNKYRTIDEEKFKSFEDDITTIIVKILRIFHFRLKTQEPITSVKFYDSGDDIDPNFMEGMWEGHYEDYVVEICSFPAVFVESDKRVYTKAQIIVRPR